MRKLKLSQLLVALVAAMALAACSSTPNDQNTTQNDYNPQPQPQQPVTNTQPVQQTEPTVVENNEPAMPVTAENFWNNPVNYDGTTDTRVIYFSFDSSQVPSAAFDTLRAHAEYLMNNANATIRLEGNTDERGTREYNVALGEHRAKAVAQFLRVQGVDASQIKIVSYGEEKPAAFGHSKMAWAKNRRVVINYLSNQP